MPWSWIIPIAASALGGYLQSRSAGSAAEEQANAAREAARVNWDIYRQNRSDFSPYRNVGYGALNRLAILMGLAPSALPPADLFQQQGQAGMGTGPAPLPYDPSTEGGGPGIGPGPGGAPASPADSGNQGTGEAPGDATGGVSPYAARPRTAPIAGDSSDVYMGGTPGFYDNALNPAPEGWVPRTGQVARGGKGQLDTGTGDATAYMNDPEFGALTRNFGLEDFQADPGYEFRLREAQRAIDRAAAAGGRLYSGRTLRDQNALSQDLASAEFGNAFNRHTTNQANLFNRLAALSGTGQTANTVLGNQAVNLGSTIGNLMQSAGAANAAGIVGQNNAWQNALQGMYGTWAANRGQQQQQQQQQQQPQYNFWESGYGGRH